MNLAFRPIQSWPGALTKIRRRAQFKAGYTATLGLLDRELQYLAAKDVVLQVALRDEDIRLDGAPRANAKPASHPGVILSFDSKHGPLSYPCDTFADWEDNLRAIALSLEHLRAVDRYGVTKRRAIPRLDGPAASSTQLNANARQGSSCKVPAGIRGGSH